MANDRMFLRHKDTGLSVYLAKTMAYGWYGVLPELRESLTQLFDVTEGQDTKDQFELVYESDPAVTNIMLSDESPGLLSITKEDQP